MTRHSNPWATTATAFFGNSILKCSSSVAVGHPSPSSLQDESTSTENADKDPCSSPTLSRQPSGREGDFLSFLSALGTLEDNVEPQILGKCVGTIIFT